MTEFVGACDRCGNRIADHDRIITGTGQPRHFWCQPLPVDEAPPADDPAPCLPAA